MTTSCDIKFDANPYGVYFPGQTLSGSVDLHLEEATKVKGVSLQIKGAADVRWSESKGAGKVRYTVYYHGRQEYLRTTSYLAGSKDGNSIELLPGIHTYRFSCVLPTNLVTSLEAVHGHIRYTVKVTLERSWKKDHAYKVAFTVLRHLNLNEDSFNIRLPTKNEKAKTFCCGPCKSTPMLITAETPISGYVPGQTIVVKIEVDNRSNKKLEELSTKLLRVVSFISQTPYSKVMTVSSIMAEVRCAGVDKQNKGSYLQHLYIPPLPPTSKTCQVLTVDYVVEVEGKISGPNINPRIHIPITLGTIPLTTIAIPTFDNLASMSTPIVHQPVTSDPDAQTPTFPVDLPPPCYEEVVNDNRANIQDEGETNGIGLREYSPRYMVYRFSEEVHPAVVRPVLEQASQAESKQTAMDKPIRNPEKCS